MFARHSTSRQKKCISGVRRNPLTYLNETYIAKYRCRTTDRETKKKQISAVYICISDKSKDWKDTLNEKGMLESKM